MLENAAGTRVCNRRKEKGALEMGPVRERLESCAITVGSALHHCPRTLNLATGPLPLGCCPPASSASLGFCSVSGHRVTGTRGTGKWEASGELPVPEGLWGLGPNLHTVTGSAHINCTPRAALAVTWPQVQISLGVQGKGLQGCIHPLGHGAAMNKSILFRFLGVRVGAGSRMSKHVA